MKIIILLCVSFLPFMAMAQSSEKLTLKGEYSMQDSINITNAYLQVNLAVEHLYNAMEAIWSIEKVTEETVKSQRILRWKLDKGFMTWLGEPTKIGKAHRKISKIYSKLQGEIILEIIKEDEGKCGRFVSAWTMPYGKVKIRLCRNFVNFGPNSQAKTIIHELGHEAGLLFDRGVYHCRSAKSVAANTKKNRATHRPENYAWLAMNYLGMECNSKRYVSPQSY